MRKLLILSFSAAVFGALAAVACVNDSPATPAAQAPQGARSGPCFATNECNAGLSCSVVNGAATCVSDGGTGTSTSSGSSSGSTSSSSGSIPDGSVDPLDSGADTGDSGDSGSNGCTVNTSKFPCGGANPPNACYGATQTCTLTGCGGAGDIIWQCNTPKNCDFGSGSDGYVCCVPTTAATADPGASCATGSLELKAGAGFGSSCMVAASCTGGAAQLCQTNADCPAVQHCTPVKITNGGASINGNTVGVCVP